MQKLAINLVLIAQYSCGSSSSDVVRYLDKIWRSFPMAIGSFFSGSLRSSLTGTLLCYRILKTKIQLPELYKQVYPLSNGQCGKKLLPYCQLHLHAKFCSVLHVRRKIWIFFYFATQLALLDMLHVPVTFSVTFTQYVCIAIFYHLCTHI